MDKSKIIEKPSDEKRNVIVFNHGAFEGYPAFLKLMREYRKQRSFVVWIPQLVGKSQIGLIIQKFQNEYTRLQNCKVGVQMDKQIMVGVSGTDCMMNGTPMIFQDSLCYRGRHMGYSSKENKFSIC